MSRYVIVFLGVFSDGKRGYRVFERENVKGHESYVPCPSVPSDIVSQEEAERQIHELTTPPLRKIVSISTTPTEFHGCAYVMTLDCGHQKVLLGMEGLKIGSALPCVDCVRERREKGIQ